MRQKPDRKNALKKATGKITRRILIGASEKERRPLLDELKKMVRQGTGEVPQTAQSLRRNYGVSLPELSPEWDLVQTRKPTAAQTIAAFDGNRSEIRVTLHLDKLIDDTTTIQLDGFGISHLIGVSISDADKATWQSLDSGGMIAIIDSPVTTLSLILHDVLLDMAMIHAKAQLWSGIREHLNSHIIAELKAQFVREKNLLDHFPYKADGKCRYLPLAAFARGNDETLNLKSYIELWSEFALFANQNANLQLRVDREHFASQIVHSHVNGKQISLAKLSRQIGQLEPGHYCLYLLIREANTQTKIAELSTFFHASKSHFRTQRWIIHPRDKHARQASIFLHERYVNVFPFYVGGGNDE